MELTARLLEVETRLDLALTNCVLLGNVSLGVTMAGLDFQAILLWTFQRHAVVLRLSHWCQ